MMEHIYFNKDKPQFHTIYISDENDMNAHIFTKENNWSSENKIDAALAAYTKIRHDLLLEYDILKPTNDIVSEIPFKKMASFIELEKRNPKEIENVMIKKFLTLAYHKRDLPMGTRKKLEF